MNLKKRKRKKVRKMNRNHFGLRFHLKKNQFNSMMNLLPLKQKSFSKKILLKFLTILKNSLGKKKNISRTMMISIKIKMMKNQIHPEEEVEVEEEQISLKGIKALEKTIQEILMAEEIMVEEEALIKEEEEEVMMKEEAEDLMEEEEGDMMKEEITMKEEDMIEKEVEEEVLEEEGDFPEKVSKTMNQEEAEVLEDKGLMSIQKDSIMIRLNKNLKVRE